MYVLSEAIKEVKRKNLEGDFVECGIWKGARKTVDEFFNDKAWFHYVDYACRYIIKR